jgi:long-chain fatty acid transport protein
MKNLHRIHRLIPLAAALVGLPAFATNGYFPHGYGMKALGMGGASTAMAQDSMGGATNPASMVWAGSRWDIGLNLFSPRREAERTGALLPSLNGQVESDSNWFAVPEFGYNRMINNNLSVGVTVYGNGGMNTDYPGGGFNCGQGAANILCGQGSLGVDLMQLIVAPTVAWKFNERHSVGASLLLGYQRFEAEGLHAFAALPGFSQTPANVTNKGSDSSTGVGVRLGYFGKLSDRVSVGAAYAPRMHMSEFDKYSGLFANAGDFDFPENYSAGIAFVPAQNWTVALDYQRINYSGVPSVGRASLPVAPLGSANGPGFGWHDIDIFKVGAAWQMNPQWTLRAGYNHSDNPIRPEDVTFNILAPGVMKSHFTAGFTYATAASGEFTGAMMYAPSESVSGPSLLNGIFGPGVAGSETVSMRQFSIGLSWGKKF